MKFRMFLSAFFNLRNIGILLLALGASITIGKSHLLPFSIDGNILLAAPAAVFIIFVFQSLMSQKFHDGFMRKEKIRNINKLNNQTRRLSYEAKKYLNSSYYKRLRKVMDDKNEVVNSFFRGERGYIKETIVEKSLNLVVAYLKLLINFSRRTKEMTGINSDEVASRINMNTRKLSFLKDPAAQEDLKKVIEMDERIILRVKEERQELERITSKLDFMESTLNMLKHQVLTSIESEDMLEKLDTAVNEASALDTVLEDRRKNRRSTSI